MKSWVRVAFSAALTASAVWTLVELNASAKRAAQRAWWA